MLKFISFGSGSSGNCYYLSTATDGLIIDIGVGIRTLKKQFREYGISLNSVRRIFVTHDHADHIKSVGSFSHDYHVPVYATRLVHQGIDHNYCVQRKVLEELKNVMEINQPVQAGEFLVRSFSVPHDASENVGYEIQVEGVTFVIITDMGSVTEEIKEVMKAVKFSPFKLTLAETGMFGDLLWLGVKGNQGLKGAVRELRAGLDAAGIPYDRKEFRPHITLIRKMTGSLPKGFSASRTDMMVKKISLMRSENKNGKMVYTEIFSIS